MKRTILSSLILLLTGSLACSGGSGPALRTSPKTDPSLPRVAILELHLDTLPPKLATQLRAKIFRRLVSGDYRRVVAQETAAARMRELGLLTGCNVGPCLSSLGKQLGVERVVTGGIAAVGSSYDVLLTLLETRGGGLLGQFGARCDVCTYQELEAMVERAVAEIHRQAR